MKSNTETTTDAELSAGGVIPTGGASKEQIPCDRCGNHATRSWEGRSEFLDLCDSCNDDLRQWLLDGGEA